MTARARQSQMGGTEVTDAAKRSRLRSGSELPAEPQGWRASKRSSKLGRKTRRAAKAQRFRMGVRDRAHRTRNALIALVQVLGIGLAGVAGFALVLVLVATGVNAGARWLALREVRQEASPQARAQKAQENLLVIGTDGNGPAEFLALRLDEDNGQILGIAIPSGAFMEVPGQGYEQVGESFSAGAEVSLAAISNYLGVPFEHYVVVDHEVYKDVMANQSLRDVMSDVKESDLAEAERQRIAEFIASVDGEHTALVPLPVKPIELGGETYLEPQRDQIADLLLQWWGVRQGAEDAAVRVIIYNGAGTPGVAGDAARQLIEAGMRVVDTKNADRFDYQSTLIVVQDGERAQGEQVRTALGVGEIVEKPSQQDIADVIIIVGKDYRPPEKRQ